ncbi:hypothetical protein [Gelidibacter gilvus]|uniref:NodB homology domain-containing protein n=1 Tax=Gelidibacter gilvus TaxID=59602 RepID=A0A4Q0XC01_9FLAO|nr:hypothetical protein [Gelidibacter gilvus]RXJ45412.1 hypothetical protein ESZ48_16475 [Gelidibacter gilvus]
MIRSINIVLTQGQEDIAFRRVHDFKYEIATETLLHESFSLKICFTQKIIGFRDHDYKWKKIDSRLIATELSPKIIKMENGQIIQANQNIGIWEVIPKSPMTLYWHFNPDLSQPMVNYTGPENLKQIESAINSMDFSIPLALLLSPDTGLELSRSEFPFKPIVCFTDHCDFDTLENLKIQRQFFKTHQIKITKGFFINQFSTRKDNASWELHSEELKRWIADGHEMAYHSLSQSIKSDSESLNDFFNFKAPLNGIRVWIDHGYQPYNFTLYKKSGLTESEFSNQLSSQNIKTLWNYIDTGTTAKGVINQLNSDHFTLKSFWKGVKGLGFKKAISLMTKNVLFHYFNDEQKTQSYKFLAVDVKGFFINKKVSVLGSLLRNTTAIVPAFMSVLFFWNSKKKEPYPLAKYSPVFFNHKIGNQYFNIFQTLEMVDLKASLCKENIDLLCEENGLFIAHTYFSVPLLYHYGRLFIDQNNINPEVEINFRYLSEKITDGSIWNPTLSEFQMYMEQYKKVEFDCDEKGMIFVKHETNICSRKVVS